MKPAATSREQILAVSMQLAAQKGFSTLNMRDIAQLCGVSVGCVYHYFPSKGELIAATVEKIWEGIFHHASCCSPPQSFIECVQWVFESIRNGSLEYPSFLSAHALGFSAAEKAEGRAVMGRYLSHIQQGMLEALQKDTAVRTDLFDDSFRPEQLVALVFDHMTLLCARREENCDALKALLKKLLYG